MEIPVNGNVLNFKCVNEIIRKKQKSFGYVPKDLICGPDWIRTSDPYDVNVVL